MTRTELADAIEYSARLPEEQRETFVAALEEVERAMILEQRGQFDAALDVVYDAIDDLLCRGQFAIVDAVLAKLDPSACSVDILVALLTATAPAGAKLAGRKQFFQRVSQVLRARNECQPGLLDGLEA